MEGNYTGKETHFNIKLKCGKNLHLKAPSAEEAKKWVQNIENIRKLYEGKLFIDLNPHRNWKEQVDLNVLNVCMEEIESNPY